MKAAPAVIVLALVMVTAIARGAAGYQINCNVVGNGGDAAHGAVWSLRGTAGQPALGSSGSSTNRVRGGFWVGCSRPGVLGVGDDPASSSQADRFESIAPNPARSRALLAFELATQAPIEMSICDVAGRVVQRLTLGTLDAGRHEWEWDGRAASGARAQAGFYFARVNVSGRRALTRTLVLLP